MNRIKTILGLFVCLGFLFLAPASAHGTNISGTIANTLVLMEDSQLVGDVTCTMTNGPCITFGVPDIKLRLNGFTITGPANPDAAPDPANPAAFCNATPGAPAADGIQIVNQTNARILGPGMVQKFRRHGILITGTSGISTKARVKDVTSHHNCFSGIITFSMSDSVIEGIASIRNSNNSGPAPCGGNCNVNSHNNRIRRNYFAGNGSVASGNNDFGVGLVFGSGGNVVEENYIGGNTNGILIHADAANNVIRRNIIVGNPPGQVTRTFGAAIGFDIRDDSTVAGTGARNRFKKNWCVSYSGPGPAPCPNFPHRGHDYDEDEEEDDDD